MADISKVKAEIASGLGSSSRRRDEARESLKYASLSSDSFPVRSKDGRFDSEMPVTPSPFMYRVVQTLCGLLYKNQPSRKLRDPVATEWLARVYRASKMWAKWKRADEFTAIGGFCALQFAGDTDPQAPVKIVQWGPHECEVLPNPDDPTQPDAVLTIDYFDTGRRLRAYTKETILDYETKKSNGHEAFGGTAWQFMRERPNPYRTLPTEEFPEGEGLIPFVFPHWFYPTSEFTTTSPGPVLARINEGLTKVLTSLGDSLPYQAFPIGIAMGVDAAWRPPAKVKPGDWLALAASDVDAAGNGPTPQLSYLAPELAYIEAIWADIQNLIDHELEMLGVPPALIRMVQSGARSGLSIQAEQLPLVSWVEGRRPQWADYEEESARMSMLVGWNRLTAAGMTEEAGRLRANLEDWSFTLRWPSLYTLLPGPERNAEDDWRLQRGFASKVTILQERQDMTEEEAYEYLAKVEEENKRLESMGIDPGTQPTAGQFPGQYSGFNTPSQIGEGQDSLANRTGEGATNTPPGS